MGKKNMQQKQTTDNKPGLHEIARTFVSARLAGNPLKVYPGALPSSLEDAYRIQDAAIDLWPEDITGWKVGRITGQHEALYSVDRLAGPIFKRAAVAAHEPVSASIFQGGFAAVEGEVVIILAEDAAPAKTDWSEDEAREMIGAIYAGAEIASSPFSGINEHGPLVTISDFGNNNGLILGDEIPDWRRFDFQDWRCETFIDGISAGNESPAAIPGGPIESLRFLLALCTRRGLPLKKGMAVSTGAITGVHEVKAGQSAVIAFKGVAPIQCNFTPFAAADPASPKVQLPAV